VAIALLADMAREPFTLDVELAAGNAVSVSMRFGRRTDLILGAGETGCHLAVEAGAVRVETRFPANPTALEALAEGLDSVLAL
jgi:hypothetical protein